MSDQAISQCSINVQSTNYQDNKSYSYTDTLSKQAVAAGIQVATTTYAVLTKGDMASSDQGMLVLVNLDESNFVLWGSTLGELKLKPKEWAKVRVTPSSSIYIKANTANVNVEKYWLSE